MTDQKEHAGYSYDQLSPEALSGLIGEFVTRDGTDSGYTRGSLAENVAHGSPATGCGAGGDGFRQSYPDVISFPEVVRGKCRRV
jgi:hypothetical protein